MYFALLIWIIYLKVFKTGDGGFSDDFRISLERPERPTRKKNLYFQKNNKH